jgi:cytochrome oxidase assembly protein ShyY1
VNRLLRPRWIVGHLLALVAIVGFILLGLWQLDRHAEKSDLRDAVAAGQALPPLELENTTEGSFRRVVAVGVYDSSLQTLVFRSHQGSSGYHVLTPLVVEDGSAVLVDRGWIPLDFDPPAPPPGTVKAAGILWPAESGSSTPDSRPDVVTRIDPEIQQAFAPYRLRSDYLVLAPTPVPEIYPVATEAPGVGLGPHLGYAGQWFLFAGVVAIGYPVLVRRTLFRDRLAPGPGAL